MKVPELQLYASFYQNFGMNITHIKGGLAGAEMIIDSDGNGSVQVVDYDQYKRGYKTPTDLEWEKYATVTESKEYILQQDWDNATGIGLITGYNEIRAIDIDKLYTGNEYGALNMREEASFEFLNKCLNMLDLPSNYPWVVRSGSGQGFHIIFYAKDIEGLYINNKAFSPNNNWIYTNYNGGIEPKFEKIELNWKFHLMLPPSQHSYGDKYSFVSGKLPTTCPKYVSVENINALFSFLCSVPKIENCTYKKQNIKLIRNYKRTCKFSSISPDIYDVRSVDDNVEWLLACKDGDSLNTLGVMYSLGINCTANLSLAQKCFVRSGTDMAKFNLATLISCGAVNGKEEYVKDLLSEFSLYGKNDGLPGITSDDLLNIKELAKKNCKEPYYLFFDTETTGLAKSEIASVSDTWNWPRLVQLSWMLTDREGNLISSGNYIIKPNGFTIPKESSKIHGITTDIAEAQGVSLINVLLKFEVDFHKSMVIVGHNIDFDKMVVGCEYYRIYKNTVGQQFATKPSFCTMKSSVDFCAIQGLWGYKYPTLQELYKRLFGTEFTGAHNAVADINATKKCFFELINRGIIQR